MSLPDDFVDRLRAELGDTFRLIGVAADLAALKENAPLTTPAAYVYVIDEEAGQNTRMNRVLQRVECDVGVMLITKNLSDPKGGAAAGDIEALRKATKRALIGWAPASMQSTGEVVELVGGKLIRANGGYVWFEQVFAAATYEGDET